MTGGSIFSIYGSDEAKPASMMRLPMVFSWLTPGSMPPDCKRLRQAEREDDNNSDEIAKERFTIPPPGSSLLNI